MGRDRGLPCGTISGLGCLHHQERVDASDGDDVRWRGAQDEEVTARPFWRELRGDPRRDGRVAWAYAAAAAMRVASMPISRNTPVGTAMAPQKKSPGSAVSRPLTIAAPESVRTPLASGSNGRRSGRKPVARMIASKRSAAGECLKS